MSFGCVTSAQRFAISRERRGWLTDGAPSSALCAHLDPSIAWCEGAPLVVRRSSDCMAMLDGPTRAPRRPVPTPALEAATETPLSASRLGRVAQPATSAQCHSAAARTRVPRIATGRPACSALVDSACRVVARVADSASRAPPTTTTMADRRPRLFVAAGSGAVHRRPGRHGVRDHAAPHDGSRTAAGAS